MSECNNRNVPERLHTNQLSINSEFSPKEILFRRFKKIKPFDELTDGILVSAALFPLSRDGDSYNREQYCSSYEDVLINVDPLGTNFEGYGVFGIPAGLIQRCDSFCDQSGAVLSLAITHDPIPCMYPHTLVHVSKNGEVDSTRKSKIALAEFRDDLRSNVTFYSQEDDILLI